jgi:DtxR family transcriptional regulator, Mn-dependent transcriptional regulator
MIELQFYLYGFHSHNGELELNLKA